MRDFFYGNIEVTIFLADDVSQEQRDGLKNDLQGDPLIQKVTYESKEQAKKRFDEQFKDAPDLVDATKAESLPESFRIKLKDPEQYKALSVKYAARPGIGEIVDQRTLLSKVFNILGSLQNLALVVAVVQGIAALMLVANTIQVAAYSKRREVAVMKLVGASNWFIQAPFVLEAVFAGLIGSLLAYGVLVLAKIFVIDDKLKPLFESLLTPVPWGNINLMLPLLAGISAVVSAVTGWITLRFYVRV